MFLCNTGIFVILALLQLKGANADEGVNYDYGVDIARAIKVINQVVIDKLMDLENFDRETRSSSNDPPLDYWDVAYHPFSKRFHPHTKRDEGYGWKRAEHVLDEHQDQENEPPQFLRVMRSTPLTRDNRANGMWMRSMKKRGFSIPHPYKVRLNEEKRPFHIAQVGEDVRMRDIRSQPHSQHFGKAWAKRRLGNF